MFKRPRPGSGPRTELVDFLCPPLAGGFEDLSGTCFLDHLLEGEGCYPPRDGISCPQQGARLAGHVGFPQRVKSHL